MEVEIQTQLIQEPLYYNINQSPNIIQNNDHYEYNNKFKINEIKKFKKKTQEQLKQEFDDELEIKEREINTILNKRLNYLQSHPTIHPKMRMILLDWLMEISNQLDFKRCTFHLSVNIIDIFLSKSENLPSKNLQLLGVCALFISAKFEEILIPNAHILSKCTDNAYGKEQIIEFEQIILKALNWKINFITLADWSNMITLKWDCFMNEIDKFISDLAYSQAQFSKPYFRKNNASSYNLMRAFFQYLDMIVLDYCYLEFTDKLLGLSLLYILMSNVMGNLDFRVLKERLCFNNEDINNNIEFNVLFERFLYYYWELRLEYLFEHIFYVSFLIDSQFSISPPKLNQNKEDQNVTFEEFLQIQIHDTNNLNNIGLSIKRRCHYYRNNNQ